MKAVGPDDKIPVSSFSTTENFTDRPQCTTVETLQFELDKLQDALEGEEREDTWERFERGLLKFAAVTRGGGYRFGGVYVEGVGVKGCGARVIECVSRYLRDEE